MRFLKCLSCKENNGTTQIKIKSSCFDKPILINISSEDESYQVIEELFHHVLEKKNPLYRRDTLKSLIKIVENTTKRDESIEEEENILKTFGINEIKNYGINEI